MHPHLVFVGRCEDGTFGIIVYEVESDAEAEEIMHADPAIVAGVMTARLHPVRAILMRGVEP